MSSEAIDQPTAVREGESLDTGKLEAFLKDSIEGLSGPLEVQQFPSGFSNLTCHSLTGRWPFFLSLGLPKN